MGLLGRTKQQNIAKKVRLRKELPTLLGPGLKHSELRVLSVDVVVIRASAAAFAEVAAVAGQSVASVLLAQRLDPGYSFPESPSDGKSAPSGKRGVGGGVGGI